MDLIPTYDVKQKKNKKNSCQGMDLVLEVEISNLQFVVNNYWILKILDQTTGGNFVPASGFGNALVAVFNSVYFHLLQFFGSFQLPSRSSTPNQLPRCRSHPSCPDPAVPTNPGSLAVRGRKARWRSTPPVEVVPISGKDFLTFKNYCSALVGNETSSSFSSILGFFKEAILLNGSISNTDGSLILRSLSMRWQFLVVCTSRCLPREIRLGQVLIFKYLSSASLAISSARGRVEMFRQRETSNVSRGIEFEMLQKFQVFRLIIPIFKLLSLGGKRGNSFNFGQSIRSSSIKQGNTHPSSAATPPSNQSSNATGGLLIICCESL
ncbi:hypothetical protein M5K25_014549 [Dendrobium thyrsiflorum]|uniref:Uncharacterized protein n=1 Tax=Dendrobium thyrsiflorum TaxID=117978 RepID=A0ABD0V3P2_DENTH